MICNPFGSKYLCRGQASQPGRAQEEAESHHGTVRAARAPVRQAFSLRFAS